MSLEPYSIYGAQRPLKVAFLVDPAAGLVPIDRIIELNREKWGGRFNPIVLTDGNVFADEQWRLLRDYDPDVIKSTVLLSDTLRDNIATFLSPLKVESQGPLEERLHLENDPVSLLPDEQLVSKVGRDFHRERSPLVVFELAETTSETIRDFLRRNFGLLDRERQTYHIAHALEGITTSIYRISDLASLNSALLALGEYRRAVFPAQLCAEPNYLPESDYDREASHFAIVVGDSSTDLSYFWNRSLRIPQWLRVGITELWLPESLASEPAIRPGLVKFLNRYIDSTGNQNQRAALFVSHSLASEALAIICQSFDKAIRFPKAWRAVANTELPVEEPRKRFNVPRGLQLHRAYALEEHLVVTAPDVPLGSTGGQHWIADVYIQFRPERFASIAGKDYWWCLPNRNSVLSDTRLFNRPARVKADRGFSVLMTRPHTIQSENTLVVRLPDDMSIAGALIRGEAFDCRQTDDHGRERSRPYHAIERSDKGMYLSGVLSLFPDLYNAVSLFDERFWRATFARMANQSDRKDSLKKIEIVNRLKKHLPDWANLLADEERLTWWAEKVLAVAKDYSKEEKDLPFEALLEDAVAETSAYNALQRQSMKFEVNEEEFRDTVSRLLAWNVLLKGVRPLCPRCGYRMWYHIDRVSQNIQCEGCQYTFALRAEERWYYRLNSLVRAAVSSHGTVPLLLVLGQLLQDARTSFMFTPCLDLFRYSDDKSRTYVRVAELDLVCVVDGRFTIGEVKNSVSLFDTTDFDDMARIAKAIKPDVVLFASLEGGPTNLIKRNLKRIAAELAPLEIEVKWYALRPRTSEPRPVR